jgi:hypothetical protein
MSQQSDIVHGLTMKSKANFVLSLCIQPSGNCTRTFHPFGSVWVSSAIIFRKRLHRREFFFPLRAFSLPPLTLTIYETSGADIWITFQEGFSMVSHFKWKNYYIFVRLSCTFTFLKLLLRLVRRVFRQSRQLLRLPFVATSDGEWKTFALSG